ncbi:MAG: NUDIX domain-containing protein [Nanoarchaeota archaeon]|nr:NUDIX domain-containing protein [Nanoarchaeota archaeon]MBU0962746.1 NUDIX domain-containing protein [Nanoarchaeota archaeon]
MNLGGRAEKDETYIETLSRELKEEIGVELTDAKYFKSYFSPSATHDPECILVFHLYLIKWKGNIIPSAEISKAIWLNKKDYKANKYQLSYLFQQIIPNLIEAGIIDL